MRGAPTRLAVGDTLVEKYDQMKQILESIAEDLDKAKGGNKAAGTRVRSAMQDIKNLAQEVRKEVLDMRKQE
ncbi:MAG: histone H1 [Planctomycetota bacterium]